MRRKNNDAENELKFTEILKPEAGFNEKVSGFYPRVLCDFENKKIKTTKQKKCLINLFLTLVCKCFYCTVQDSIGTSEWGL